MNERIKELAKQAGIDFGNFESVTIDIDNAEKFAELIVQQCMSMCDERRAVYFGQRVASDVFIDKNMYAEGEAACEAIRYNIKHHFGVEE
jgi:hypothetical protein